MIDLYYGAFVVVAIALLEVIGRRYRHEELERIDDPEKQTNNRLSFARFYIEYSFSTIGFGALLIAGILRWYGYSESYIYL